MKKGSIFIVAPNGDWSKEDLEKYGLYQVCRVIRSGWCLQDVYALDIYEEIYSTSTLKDAIKRAKKYGAKRPTII